VGYVAEAQTEKSYLIILFKDHFPSVHSWRSNVYTSLDHLQSVSLSRKHVESSLPPIISSPIPSRKSLYSAATPAALNKLSRSAPLNPLHRSCLAIASRLVMSISPTGYLYHFHPRMHAINKTVKKLIGDLLPYLIDCSHDLFNYVILRTFYSIKLWMKFINQLF
jgi:hypothetical protein